MEGEFKVPLFEPKLKSAATAKKTQTDAINLPETDRSCSEEETKSNKNENVEADAKPVPKCPYTVPKWSSVPDSDSPYCFEVLKGGQIIETTNDLQAKAYWTFGKMPSNDIMMIHPTISRFHAVLQYRPEVDGVANTTDDSEKANTASEKPKVESGWYLYDLGSTHGSFVNKMKVPSKTYIRVRVGYMLKFGASTRSYILQGPDFDAEDESPLTITEMKQLKLQKQLEQKEKAQKALEAEIEREKKKEEQGISWGMGDDADEETDLSHNPYATTTNEELFLQDPKKTLRGYFEREGHDLDYKVEDGANGTYTCRIELPITDQMGRGLVAEFTHKGKKKECVVQCALEACRILDRNGVLRQANHESRKRKVQSSDDDDDDEFYDRTYQAQEKRERKTAVESDKALSYDELLEEEKKLISQQTEIEQRIADYHKLEKQAKQNDAMEVDDLDDFMQGLSKDKAMDKTDVRKCRYELQQIKASLTKVRRLIIIVRPADLPAIKRDDATGTTTQKKLELPLFGKKRTFGLAKSKAATTIAVDGSSSTTTTSTTIYTPMQSNIESKTNTTNDQMDFVEEFDEDDTYIDTPNKEALIKEKDANKRDSQHDDVHKMDHANNEINALDKKQPASMSNDKTECKDRTESDACHDSDKVKNILPTPTESMLPIDTEPEKSESKMTTVNQTRHKSRSRNANKVRGQRAHIDVDEGEEEKSPNKFADWLPPQNQSGDGITDLNSKFGY